MNTTNEKLVDWAIAKIKKEFKNDVCLLIGNDPLKLEQDSKGVYFNYFVPVNENGYALSKTFIVDGIGYDLYPRSWDRIEKMANLDDYNPTCLGNVQILYYRNEEDKNCFLTMQQKLQDNLRNKEFTFKKALEKLKVAMEIYQTMMFEDKIGKIRMAAGFIADYLSVAVAFVNQTYFKYTQINQIAELSALKALPDNFISYYNSIIGADSADELKNLSHAMIQNTRKFMSEKRTESKPNNNAANFHNLAGWYQELCYTWRRIYDACDKNDANKAFSWGCELQNELEIVKEEYGLDEMDLLGKFSAIDLSNFRKQSEVLEKYIVAEIKEHGVELEMYNSIDDFLAKNS